jgi:hypothetical protein
MARWHMPEFQNVCGALRPRLRLRNSAKRNTMEFGTGDIPACFLWLTATRPGTTPRGIGTRHAEEGLIAARELLRRGKLVTALVAFNDVSALGAMTALREAGYKVPEDVSVMGFDDIEFASIAYPPLTTIRQPLHEMGASAAELLLRKLAHDERVRNLRVRPELIVRSTTCPAPVASLRGVPRRKVSSSR